MALTVLQSFPPAERLYLEKKIAESLGLARDLIGSLRKEHLAKKQWRQEGRELVLTEDGLARLLEVVSATTNADLPASFDACLLCPPKKNGTGEAAGDGENGWVELEVCRIWPNEKLILARTAEGAAVNVIVPTNVNFVPKMKLRARPMPERSGFYKLDGRCPRSKGRY